MRYYIMTDDDDGYGPYGGKLQYHADMKGISVDQLKSRQGGNNESSPPDLIDKIVDFSIELSYSSMVITGILGLSGLAALLYFAGE